MKTKAPRLPRLPWPVVCRFRAFRQLYRVGVVAGRLYERPSPRVEPIEVPVLLDTSARTLLVGKRCPGELMIPALVRAMAMAWADEVERAGYARIEIDLAESSITLRPVCPAERWGSGQIHSRSYCLTVLDPAAVGVERAVKDAVRHANHLFRLSFGWRVKDDEMLYKPCRFRSAPRPAIREGAWSTLPVPPLQIVRRADGRRLCPHCGRSFVYLGYLRHCIDSHGDAIALLRMRLGGIVDVPEAA